MEKGPLEDIGFFDSESVINASNSGANGPAEGNNTA